MTSVGIVGAGIAGVHLALYLQRHGVDCTIYTDRSGDELRAGRLPNTVALMGATRARDTELGVNHWNEPEQGTHALRIRIAGDPPLVLQGDVDEPFLLGPRTDNELADYDAGFKAGGDGRELDDTETLAWQRGWAEAQEY